MTVPWVGTPWIDSFQPSSEAMALNASGVTSVEVWVPTDATPVETEFQPWAWAPITARSMPPARPSNTWPKRSTRKL